MPDAPPIRAASALLPWVAKAWPAETTVARSGATEADQAMLSSMDEASFRALYERMARPLWAYLCHASGNPATAEDLVQDTFCRFLASTPPLMSEAETRTYLYRIATNLLKDRWRRGDAQLPVKMPERHTQDDLDSRIAVRAALQQLKPRERQLLWLAYVQGFDHREIGQALGLRRASVRLLLFRARRRLAAVLNASAPLPRSVEVRGSEV